MDGKAGPREGISPTESGGHSKSSMHANTKASHMRANSAKNKSTAPVSSRPCKEHSFLTDVADVRAMEQGLLQLLEDFHSGKLQAFGGGCTFEKMDQIRDQQERLARLHFELDVNQDMQRNDPEARKISDDNLSKLTEQLEGVSCSIELLQKNDIPGQKNT